MTPGKLREAANDLCERDPEGLDATFTTAIEALRTLAAHMESASQGFEEWLDDGDNSLSHCPCGSCDMKRAWHAAQAAMQAKLDAANAEIERIRDSMSWTEAKALDAAAELRQQLDAANEKVRELEAWRSAQQFDDDFLGQIVRHAWVEWAKKQPNPKPSWLVPWNDLSEPDKEADRCIGRAVANIAVSPDLLETEAALATAERERELLRKEVRRMKAEFSKFADNQYCKACEIAKRDECLGRQHKLEHGTFTEKEYQAHKLVNERFGAHYAIYDMLKQIDADRSPEVRALVEDGK